MGEAIETTQTLYPGLLESRPNLLFLLKVTLVPMDVDQIKVNQVNRVIQWSFH